MDSELWAALAGAVVGFVLSLVPRLFDRHARHREARAAAANSAIEWAYRVAFATDDSWPRTLEAWTDESGITVAKFSAAPSRGNKYPLGWFSGKMTELVGERNNLSAAQRLTLAAEIRDAMVLWVENDDHVHWFASRLKAG